MIFADHDLSRRLERPEAIAGARFVEARRRLAPESEAEWIEVAGAYAMFDGPDSPITQTFGLGLFETLDDEALGRIERFFQDRGATVNHEVSPLAGVPVFAKLAARGYRPVEFTSVMYQPLPRTTASATARDTGIRVRVIDEGEQDVWSEVSARGWAAERPELQKFLLGLGRVLSASDGAYAVIAEMDGTPVAAGMLRCEGGVALFGGAATVPEARRHGAQRALLEARMAIAMDVGCDLAMMCAEPGSASQRNAERQGFRIAYTRTKWQLCP
jgi:hypothetical protein